MITALMPRVKILENLYVRTIKIILYLILFLPFMIIPSFVFPYITGKNIAFRLLVEFASVLWICLLILNDRYRLRSSTLLSVVMLFIAIVGLADLTGVNPYNSFWSNYERMEGYITMIHLALYFIILKSILKSRGEWGRYVTVFLAVSFFVSLEALFISPPDALHWPYSESYVNRIYGVLGNPPFLASYMLLSAYIAFIAISFTRTMYLKIIYMIISIMNFTVIYFTATRGAILAGIFGLVMICIFRFITGIIKNRDKLIRRTVVFPIIALMVICMLVFLILNNTDFARHDRTVIRFGIMFSDLSVQSRFNAWKMAWEGIQERPILGWGQENFIGIYTRNTIFAYSRLSWMDRAHNIIIDWLVNAGVLGLVSYLSIFGTAFYVLWKKYRMEGLLSGRCSILVTTLTVYFIHNLFTFDTISTYTVFFALLAFIDSDALKKESVKSVSIDTGLSIKITGKVLIIFVASVVLFAFAFYYVTYKPLKQIQMYQRIIRTIPKYRSLSVLLGDFENALSYRTFGDRHVRVGMVGISSSLLTQKQFRNRDDTGRFVNKTVEELSREVEENRYDLEYLTHAIDFYWLVAEVDPSFIESAIELIEECIQINPAYHGLYVTLADVYLLKKDYKSAFAALNTIVGDDPDNDKLQFKLSLLAILNTEETVANRALERVKNIRMKNSEFATSRKSILSTHELTKLAGTYLSIKNYQRALHYYQVALDVTDDVLEQAKIHLDIAKIYLAVGDKDNARKEARQSRKIIEFVSDGPDSGLENRKARLQSRIREFIHSIDGRESPMNEAGSM